LTLLGQERTYARDIATNFPDLAGVGQLLGTLLHTQRKLRPEQILQFLIESRFIFSSEFSGFHESPLIAVQAQEPTWRNTNVVRNGNLAAASANAARAVDVNTVHFIQNFAGLDFSYEILRVTFTITHPNFCGFLAYRFVGENSDKNATASLNVSRHRTSSRFNLARSEASTGGRF
jgi:hypothetical protein